MKSSPERKLFDAITDLPDHLIEEAGKTKLNFRYRTYRRMLALTACAALILCFILFLPQKNIPPVTHLSEVFFPKAYAFGDDQARLTIRKEHPVENSFLSSVQSFSYDTASHILADTDNNSAYSPLSLYYALALAASGAKGDTWKELASLLHVSDQKELSAQCFNLYHQLYTDNEVGKLKIANSLWMDYRTKWKQPFIDLAAKQFFASAHSVDFKDESTASSMSQWVAEQTEQTLSPHFSVSDIQLLSILNTIYFKDEWTIPFHENTTSEDSFYLSDGSMISCNFMNRTDCNTSFYRGNQFLRASLNFKNGSRMIFILPNEGISPYDLLSSPQQLREAMEGGEEMNGTITWKIPTFSFSSSSNLVEPLQDLGLSLSFCENADFSGIADGQCYFSTIRQGTYLSINENGAEASAFTEVTIEGSAMPDPDNNQVDMILNRPFIYGIMTSNNMLLLVGTCTNPTLS